MKTKLVIHRLLVLLPVFAVLLIISSCAKEEIVIAPESEIPADFLLKNGEISVSDNMVCELIAGKNMNAGKVVYSHDEDNLYVEYVAMDGWMISEVHFYVGNMDDFEKTCMNKNKRAVQIGKFPYSDSDLNDETVSFTIPLDDIVDPGADGYLVVAHAVVKKGGQEETAFAKCDYFITTTKARMVNDEGKEFYGESEGTPFIDFDPDYWCSFLGTNVYNGADTYRIGSWYNYYGEVSVNDDGTNLLIDVTANEGYTLTGVWVYVGPLNGLQSYLSDDEYDGICPKYWEFPLSSYEGGESNSFSIPLPKSTSFEDAFINIKRWGWISYYNF